MARDEHPQAGNIEKRGVVANVDIRLPLVKIFFAVVFVPDKGEHAKHPRPQPKKSITNPAEPLAKQKGPDNAWKKKDHEHRKHDEHPELVERK